MRRENLVLGDPIDQVAEAEGCAKHGEVVASFQCLDLLARSSEFLSESLIESHKDQKSGVIARGVTAMFAPGETFRFQYANRKDTDIITTKLKEQLDMMDTSHLQRFLKLLSLYVHPVSVQASREAHHVIAASMQERRAAEAELRNVCVLFIMPRLSTKPSGDDVQDNKLFSLLNDVFNVTTRELRRFHGHLRQYIVDDKGKQSDLGTIYFAVCLFTILIKPSYLYRTHCKGVVLIATFGLRGSTIPGMIAERALPFATTIHRDLLKELGVENRIGMTMGSVYCGVVGGILRHEYAALGPSVNLAARLMASTENPVS
jgi:class 3 adenylate cyclase